MWIASSPDFRPCRPSAASTARLRARSGTYILDFQNEIEDIQLAFKPFYEEASLEETSVGQHWAFSAQASQSNLLAR